MKYYVVFIKRKRCNYNSWPECQEQVIEYKGNVYKSYKMFEKVRQAWVFHEPHWKSYRKHIYAKLWRMVKHKEDNRMHLEKN